MYIFLGRVSIAFSSFSRVSILSRRWRIIGLFFIECCIPHRSIWKARPSLVYIACLFLYLFYLILCVTWFQAPCLSGQFFLVCQPPPPTMYKLNSKSHWTRKCGSSLLDLTWDFFSVLPKSAVSSLETILYLTVPSIWDIMLQIKKKEEKLTLKGNLLVYVTRHRPGGGAAFRWGLIQRFRRFDQRPNFLFFLHSQESQVFFTCTTLSPIFHHPEVFVLAFGLCMQNLRFIPMKHLVRP